ncbi:hypothetical protein CAL7716_107560 (plasmid) [Calothrix sp. PCC 7716]|nr:hypothetical protein CAL7716_107560 [Calothrix sp. PCC 7716]
MSFSFNSDDIDNFVDSTLAKLKKLTEEHRQESLHHAEQALYHLKLANRKNFITSTPEYKVFNYSDTVLMLESLIAILKSPPQVPNDKDKQNGNQKNT